MLMKLSGLLLLLGLINISSAAIPSYIKICKRNDPKIDQCIIDSINFLRPKLVKGIPELDVPPIEPLYFDEFVVSKGNNFKAIGTNVKVIGASNYKITSLKADTNKQIFQIGLSFPYINVEADYDVNMKLLTINLKGKGPLQSNNSDVTIQAIAKGHKNQKDKKTYLLFDSLDLKIKWKNYNIRLENLFGGDKVLGDAVNGALNENKKEIINLIRPKIEKMMGEKMLGVANKITQHFTYDELFPAK
ncbi:unnamed protein product [Nezara viridula]|uniref:Uncharacterized protein n=1 Tax=Nezara viridula TaxID=85310 RepID=A0A9P0HBK1_NEZVI|nr:unnamed protein product [Nezara viridula]